LNPNWYRTREENRAESDVLQRYLVRF
jgi:hypothetical protein